MGGPPIYQDSVNGDPMIERRLSCSKTLNAVFAWLMIIIWSGAHLFYEIYFIIFGGGFVYVIGPLIVNLLFLFYGIFNVRVI